MSYSTEEGAFINLFAKPNSPILGKRLGKRFKHFKGTIESLSSDTINEFQETGQIVIDGESLSGEDLLIFREARPGTNAVSDRFISIDLDCTLNEELVAEGLAREVVNRIQRSRKELGFNVADRVVIQYTADGSLEEAIRQHRAYIMRETLCIELNAVANDGIEFDIDGDSLRLTIRVSE